MVAMTAREMVEKRLPDSVYLGAVATPEGNLSNIDWTYYLKDLANWSVIYISDNYFLHCLGNHVEVI